MCLHIYVVFRRYNRCCTIWLCIWTCHDVATVTNDGPTVSHMVEGPRQGFCTDITTRNLSRLPSSMYYLFIFCEETHLVCVVSNIQKLSPFIYTLFVTSLSWHIGRYIYIMTSHTIYMHLFLPNNFPKWIINISPLPYSLIWKIFVCFTHKLRIITTPWSTPS